MQLKSVTAVLLAGLTLIANAQRICTIQPAGCTIGTQACPTGCIKKARCTSTITSVSTKTLPASTITSTRTSTVTQPTTSTKTTTLTQTQSAIRITVTVTASTSTGPAPECATETPYVNLFTFPDTECKNQTTTDVLGIPIAETYRGLSGQPIKFNTLAFKSSSHPNASTCALLQGDGARSVYYTIDGVPSTGRQPGCFMNMYTNTDCSESAETLFGRRCSGAVERVRVWLLMRA